MNGDEQDSENIVTGTKAKNACQELEGWLRKNSGVVRDIGGPRDRRTVPALMKWLAFKYGRILWGSNAGMCWPANLVHAVAVLRGGSVEASYLSRLKEIRPVIGSLSVMSDVAQQMKGPAQGHKYERLELQGLKNYERKAFSNRSYEWLSEQRLFFVVLLPQPGKVDRILFVDGQRIWVWDNEEYPIVLNSDSLRMCSGVRSKNA